MAEKTSRRRSRGLTMDEIQDRYPSIKHLTGPPGKASERAWVAAFTVHPDAMHLVLADLIKQVHATPGRIGQRPMPREELVDFDGLIYGEENEAPLTEAIPALMGSQSERAFCAKIPMSRGTFQRMLRGEYHPDVRELRAIAAAFRKPPTYFLEYRKAMAIAAFIQLLDARPGFATSLYRHYLEVRTGETQGAR